MAWSEWKNVGTDFEELTIVTVSGKASVYGGAEVAGQTKTGQTSTYTVTKSGKVTLISNAYANANVGGFSVNGLTVYHNGVALTGNSPITINVKQNDTIYAIGTFKVGGSTNTSHVGFAHIVLTVIEHD